MDEPLREVSYLCTHCKQTRRLKIDPDLHLQRREIGINGLATYIDIHGEKDEVHGVKLSVDQNFHVRTNSLIKIAQKKETAKTMIPIPGLKIKELNTNHVWNSWTRLELESKGGNIKFVLENDGQNKKMFMEKEYQSSIGAVTCKICHIKDDLEDSKELMQNTGEWIQAFIKYLELAPDLHVDLIPEILKFIDDRAHFPPSYTDEQILATLMDRSAILIPYSDSLEKIAKYGETIRVPNVDSKDVAKIADKLSRIKQLKMSDIQSILKEFMKDGALEEELIVNALGYFLLIQQFETKLSFVN